VDPILLESIIILILVFLSAVFSGIETALTSISMVEAQKAIDEGSKREKILTLWIEHPTRMLTTILVGNNIFNITASSLATDISYRALSKLNMADMRGVGIAAAVGVMTFLILVFGEIVPKTYARHNVERYLVFSRIIRFFYRLFGVISYLMGAITLPLVKLFGGRTDQEQPEITTQDIAYMIRMGHETGSLDEGKQELLHSAIEFTDTTVREVMVPRTEMDAYDLDDPIDELYDVIGQHNFSRFPVYRDDVDNVLGIFYAKDLMNALISGRDDFTPDDVEKLLHKPYLVPESKKIHELLNEFQSQKVHLAIVVDEFGGTAGIVTMEDLLEELVGEIYDEFDVDVEMVREITSSRYLVAARMELDDLQDALGLALPESQTYGTLGGYLIDQAGSIPARGSQFAFEGWQLVVRERDERRLKTVEIVRPSAAAGAAPDEP
jgi:putative hemolysin